jgi:hypothetical protein
MANPLVQQQDFNGILDFSRTLTFNRYNASETLTSISISLNLQINGGSLIIDNDSNDSALGTFEFGENAMLNSTDVLLTGGPGPAQAYNFLSINLGGNFDDGVNDFSPNPPDGNVYNGGIVPNTQSGLIDSSCWSQYQGTGTYDIMVGVSLQTHYTGTGYVEYSLTTPISVTGYVEVVYTCIPEPATVVLLAFGILAILRKNRSNKAIYHT